MSISAAFQLPGGSGTRKRLISNADEAVALRKRPRVSSMSAGFQAHLTGQLHPIRANLDRLPRAQSLLDAEFESVGAPHYAHPLTRSSSFAGYTRTSRTGPSPGSSLDHGPIPHHGMALMRSVSAASFSSSSEITPVYSEISAKHYLRSSRVSIDFSVSSTDPGVGALPLSWSTQNMLLFSRGNRVHYKNMSTGEEIGQLCKLRASWGDLRLIECGGADQSNVAAIGTSKGYVQIWDLTSKKITANWTTKGVASMCWNGPVLTVGGLKGTIRHYDTRTKETPKMKEQAKKVTRHQAKITRLSWNVDGNYLASGDESGTIYSWDSRQKVPLDVGEFVQRRKKMQHAGVITALTWCPWQPRLLASGDSTAAGKGTVRLWNVNPSYAHTNATDPGRLEADGQITSLHFSPHCKELLSTHGPGPSSGDPDSQSSLSWPRKTMTNSVVVHSYPSLRHVTTTSVASKGVGDSVLSPNGMKIVLSVPEENTLKVWDVWGKRKELRRQPSFLDRNSIR